MYVQTNKDKTTRVAGLPHVLETTLFMASFERSTWLAFRCKLPETIENQQTRGRLLSSSIDVTMIFDVSYRTDENCEPASRHASLSLLLMYTEGTGAITTHGSAVIILVISPLTFLSWPQCVSLMDRVCSFALNNILSIFRPTIRVGHCRPCLCDL